MPGHTGCDNAFDDGCMYYPGENVIACNPEMLPGRSNDWMLFKMAMYEFGHAIGMGHQECQNSFMNHFVPDWTGSFVACDIEFFPIGSVPSESAWSL